MVKNSAHDSERPRLARLLVELQLLAQLYLARFIVWRAVRRGDDKRLSGG